MKKRGREGEKRDRKEKWEERERERVREGGKQK